jgi:D-3-phosphoglycerate dehydrogenase / 2-oxoglutarate reductase
MRGSGDDHAHVETTMPDPVEALIIDLLEWIGRGERPYAEVMDAWRTSCPRLPVWEEANARGYIERTHSPRSGASVALSPLGLAMLERYRRPKTPRPSEIRSDTEP